jgi:hypothetical protein
MDERCAEDAGPTRGECTAPKKPVNRSLECLDYQIKILEEKLAGYKALRSVMESASEKTPLGGVIAELLRHRF